MFASFVKCFGGFIVGALLVLMPASIVYLWDQNVKLQAKVAAMEEGCLFNFRVLDRRTVDLKDVINHIIRSLKGEGQD